MIEYQKIDNLYEFDIGAKRYIIKFHSPIVEYLKDVPWIGTEKIDGTNIRIHWDGYEFEIAGRTSKSDVPKEIQEIFKKKFDSDMEVIFEQKFGKKDVILFCEGYGGKIQNGAYDCETSLIGFDVMVNDMYLDKFEAKSIFEELGIDFVPMTIFANLGEAIKYVQEHSQSIKHPTCALEGLVCAPAVRIYDVNGKRVIVKIKGRELKKVKE